MSAQIKSQRPIIGGILLIAWGIWLALSLISNWTTLLSGVPQPWRSYLQNPNTPWVLLLICFSVLWWNVHNPTSNTALQLALDGLRTRDDELKRADVAKQRTIENQQVELADLKSELAALESDHKASKPRNPDRIEMLRGIDQLLANGVDLRKHAIYIYPVPTVHDSGVVANRIKEALEHIDLHPHIKDGLTKSDLPFMEFGTWVYGDSSRSAERALASWLTSVGLHAHTVDIEDQPGGPKYNGFEIWIAVGDASASPDLLAMHNAFKHYLPKAES